MNLHSYTLYQITGYYPPHVGGMELFVQRLAHHLIARKHQVQVVASDIGHVPEQQNLGLVSVSYLKSVEFLTTPFAWGLFSTLSQAPVKSIFHLHVAQAFFPEVTALVAWWKGIPFIAHVHLDVGHTTLTGRFILPMYKWLCLRPVLHAAAQVIVQTKDYQKLIHKKYQIPLSHITIVPNGIALLRPNAAKIRLPKPPYRLLFVGRLVNQKRVDLVLDTARCLADNQVPFHLDIVGDGPELRALRQQVINLRLEKMVAFCGALDELQVAEKYQRSDCLLQTSERESFSTVLLEALNHGCPIVATDIPSTRTILTNRYDALLCSNTPAVLAHAVTSVVTDAELRQHLIQNGYRTVQQYGWDHIVDKLEDVYRRAVTAQNKNTTEA